MKSTGETKKPSGDGPIEAAAQDDAGNKPPPSEARASSGGAGQGSSQTRDSEGEASSAPDEVKQLQSVLAQKEREARANYDRFLRERAELENFKRRMHREKGEALKYAAESLIRDLLPVIDNLERAIAHAQQRGDGEPVAEGLSLVLKSFLDALERHGVKQVSPKGKAFDPALHEALAHVESDTEKPNTIIEEYHKGYLLHDRLLRPAGVVVAKAPDKPAGKGNSGGGPVENPGSDG